MPRPTKTGSQGDSSTRPHAKRRPRFVGRHTPTRSQPELAVNVSARESATGACSASGASIRVRVSEVKTQVNERTSRSQRLPPIQLGIGRSATARWWCRARRSRSRSCGKKHRRDRQSTRPGGTKQRVCGTRAPPTKRSSVVNAGGCVLDDQANSAVCAGCGAPAHATKSAVLETREPARDECASLMAWLHARRAWRIECSAQRAQGTCNFHRCRAIARGLVRVSNRGSIDRLHAWTAPVRAWGLRGSQCIIGPTVNSDGALFNTTSAASRDAASGPSLARLAPTPWPKRVSPIDRWRDPSTKPGSDCAESAAEVGRSRCKSASGR